jgi:hypothetical protein
LAGWPDGPARHRLKPRLSTTTQLGQQPPHWRVLAAYKPRTATTRWPPRNLIRAAHRGITARAIHPGHAGPAGTPPGQTMLVRFVGRSFSTTSASSIINKCHQERGVNEAEPLDT